MSINFNNPALSNTYSALLTDIRDMQSALATMNFTGATGTPTGSISWSTGNNRFERWNGSAWAAAMPDASTTVRGPVLLNDTLTSSSTVLGATANAVKQLNDAKLNVSGFTITAISALSGTFTTTKIPTLTVSHLPPELRIEASGNYRVSAGSSAGATNQGVYSVAVGRTAGQTNQGTHSIAAGYEAGTTAQGNYSTALGYHAGHSSQGGGAVAVGQGAAGTSQGASSVAIGGNAGGNTQGTESVAVGNYAGYRNQGADSVAVGYNAGANYASASSYQMDYSVAVGYNAYTASGTISYDGYATAVGPNASASGVSSAAYGRSASASAGGAVSIGSESSATGDSSVAVGVSALASYAGAVAVGVSTIASFGSTVAVGDTAGAIAGGATAVGADSLAGDQNSTSVGCFSGTDTAYTGWTCLGYQATVITANNQIQIGASGSTTYAYGAVQNRSDARDKADIRDTELGLDFINALRPVQFKWDMREDYRTDRSQPLAEVTRDGSKKRSRFHNGLIAQEVAGVCDALGVDFAGLQHHEVGGGSDVYSIGYEELIAPLIKAVQQLSARVAELEGR